MARNGNGNGKKLDVSALESWLWEAGLRHSGAAAMRPNIRTTSSR